MTIWGPGFLGGIQSTKWVLLEILSNFWRCCFWLCCASFSFCFGTFIQRFASGKMRILEAQCWNMSLDLHVFLLTCARKGQDIGQNRMRKVGKKENVKFLLHIYFRHLRRDIYWIYVSNLLRRRFHKFHPFSPEKDSGIWGKSWQKRQNKPSEQQYLGLMPSVLFGEMRADIGQISAWVIVFGWHIAANTYRYISIKW